MQPLINELYFNKYLSISSFLFFQGAVLVILLIVILLLVFLVKTHSKKKSKGEILVCGHFWLWLFYDNRVGGKNYPHDPWFSANARYFGFPKSLRWLINYIIRLIGALASWLIIALVSESNDPGSSSCREHCVVFLGKTLYSYSASLHPGV